MQHDFGRENKKLRLRINEIKVLVLILKAENKKLKVALNKFKGKQLIRKRIIPGA